MRHIGSRALRSARMEQTLPESKADFLLPRHTKLQPMPLHLSTVTAAKLRKFDAGATLLVDRTLPLDAIGEALARQASGGARGKIMLTP